MPAPAAPPTGGPEGVGRGVRRPGGIRTDDRDPSLEPPPSQLAQRGSPLRISVRRSSDTRIASLRGTQALIPLLSRALPSPHMPPSPSGDLPFILILMSKTPQRIALHPPPLHRVLSRPGLPPALANHPYSRNAE